MAQTPVKWLFPFSGQLWESLDIAMKDVMKEVMMQFMWRVNVTPVA